MNRKAILLFLFLLSIILIIRFIFYFSTTKPYPEGKNIAFETQVQTQPKISLRGQQISLTLPNSQRAIVFFELNPPLSYGDRIALEGKIDYFTSQKGDKVAFISYPEFILIEKGTKGSLIVRIRESIIGFFNSSFNPKYSTLMLGIVFGIKQEMPEGFYNNLQKSGLLHVIAASGMNITMVGGFLLGLFAIFFRRQTALILTIFGILFYALLAGFEPSIVRASIMGILVFLAQLTGRQSSSFLGLFVAGTLMLLKAPGLIFDIGFQLSFMATLGLIYFRPFFFVNKKIKSLIQRSIIGEDLATTISAQIFTLPILLSNFGNYSIFSVIANALVLWTVPILMVIGAVAVVLGLVIEPIGTIILYLSIPFLLYFEKIAEFTPVLGGQFEIDSFPILLFFGYYLILLSIILLLRKKR
ncbi:MAG: ComEC/Rec2 family competence protein [Candidatus Levybacteria bacterium]|nr:ComEC/Rec2 family competence protein [Candidatus Levybacteria bacterium]